MNKKVKIYGAGSIGNHLAQASRRMGWSVDMCDIDTDALNRTKNDIYPARYGEWDDSIGLYKCDDVPIGGYDLIIIGTPPDSHVSLARAAIKEGTQAILIEKPLATPDLAGMQELFEEANTAGCIVFVGYDHAVSKSALKMSSMLKDNSVGSILTLDVEFREYWGGIFNAHPWLDGPSDTYLGYWKRGGGSCGEHSHAINLWQSFAYHAGVGRITEVTANMDYVNDGKVDYDSVCLMNFKTEKGLIGRVVQDVITKPTRKWARVQGSVGNLEWFCGQKTGTDTVIYSDDCGQVTTTNISKTRPDDFFQEIEHIDGVINGQINDSPISLNRGLDTMLVIAAAHKSATEGRTVTIDYSEGYTETAIK